MRRRLTLIVVSVMLSLAFAGCADEAENVNLTTEAVDVNSTTEAEDENLTTEAVEISEASDDISEEEVTEEEVTEEEAAGLDFLTEDIDGNTVSLSDFANASLIMINFWEPWCGPCVGEMSDLERLYEEYKDEGFVILGVFSSYGVDEDVRDVMDYCQTTYPIVRYVDSMEPYITEYVPTTVFMDAKGNALDDEPLIGARSYDDWQQIIEYYMNR